MSDAVSAEEFMAWARDKIDVDLPLVDSYVNTATSVFGSILGREFTLVTGATSDSTRTYRPDGPRSNWLAIHDLATITSVSESGATLVSGTDYVPWPNGNRNTAGDYRPYTALERIGFAWDWDFGKYTVSIVGKWGWTSFPSVVSDAIKVMAKDWALSRETAFGSAGITEAGFSVRMRENPLVQQAVNTLRGSNGWGVA